MPSLTPRSLFSTVLALAAALVLLGGIVVWNSYRTAIGKAEGTSRNLATVLDEHAAHSLDTVDQRLRMLFDLSIDGQRRTNDEIGRLVARTNDRSGLVRGFTVADDQGRLLFDQMGGQPVASLDAFARQRDNPAQSLFIGTPSRVADGSWQLPVSRGFRGSDGQFLGVAIAYLDLAAFDRFYATLDLGENGAVAVARADGRLLWRHPMIDLTDPPAFKHPVVQPDAFEAGRSGNYQGVSPVDGQSRIIGYVVDHDNPFTVFVAVNRKAALADWQDETVVTGLVATLLVVCLVMLGWRLQGEMIERTRGFADLERQASALAVNTMQLDMARHLAEEAEERLRNALDALSEGFLLWDSEDRLVLCNDAAHVLDPDPGSKVEFGQSFGELLDDRLERGLIPTAIGREPEYRNARLISHLNPGMPIEFETAEGQILRVVERRTTEGGIVTLRSDVTAQRQLERALIEARQEAEAGSRAKSEFLASMSHELRTPLNAVIGFAELIHGEMLGNDAAAYARYREYAGDIRDSGSHLLGLINDILDFSKTEAGELQLIQDPVDLNELIDSAVRMLKPRAERAGILLNTRIPSNLPPVLGDGMRLRQILLNLMSNAIKYTPEAGHVSVSVESTEGGVLIKVADTGIGIAPEDMSTVLEPFRQIDNDLNRRNPGTGLGLPLTKRLVELHQGVLELESRVGHGTTAVVRLPANQDGSGGRLAAAS
ncbi:MAG TPA: ATP-binding protein [Aliidongia sp.]|uniref:ATP-binding protein n=1 Tax=Aliidongia sp. TaxID=1914230 RepID=UPI002DDD76C4|nr:ATP-binding protein [Aliidongia sp.]HEV2676279.1 ATP-binding protein [Aliidongia sp.]